MPIEAQQAGARARGSSSWPVCTSSSRRAPPDAVSWNLTPDGLERLTQTFAWLFDEIHGEFTFELLWGEDPIDKLVSRDELIRIVPTGHLAGRTRYRVVLPRSRKERGALERPPFR